MYIDEELFSVNLIRLKCKFNKTVVSTKIILILI